MKDRRSPRPDGGFSLVELLVVITIIGILATIVTVKVMDAVAQAKVTKAKAEISEIKKAVQMYYVTVGRMPETIDDLSKPTKSHEDGFIEVGRDPWGNEYEYERVGARKCLIRSLGADGSAGGEGLDADIDSDHLTEESEDGGK